MLPDLTIYLASSILISYRFPSVEGISNKIVLPILKKHYQLATGNFFSQSFHNKAFSFSLSPHFISFLVTCSQNALDLLKFKKNIYHRSNLL